MRVLRGLRQAVRRIHVVVGAVMVVDVLRDERGLAGWRPDKIGADVEIVRTGGLVIVRVK